MRSPAALDQPHCAVVIHASESVWVVGREPCHRVGGGSRHRPGTGTWHRLGRIVGPGCVGRYVLVTYPLPLFARSLSRASAA